MLLNALYNYKTRQFVRRRVREHRDTFDGENVRDFVDLYLQAERSAEADPAYTGSCQSCIHVRVHVDVDSMVSFRTR